MSIDRRLRCERTVLVGSDTGNAYGLVRASSCAETVPSATSATIRSDDRPVANMGGR